MKRQFKQQYLLLVPVSVNHMAVLNKSVVSLIPTVVVLELPILGCAQVRCKSL